MLKFKLMPKLLPIALAFAIGVPLLAHAKPMMDGGLSIQNEDPQPTPPPKK